MPVQVQVDPPSNPVSRSTSAFAEDVGSIHMSDTQNNLLAAPGCVVSNVTVTVNHPVIDSGSENTGIITHAQQEARADHEIYYSQLLTKKIGFPLWVPGPGMRLPVEYRRRGISIGDVGIITSTGAFDFLFNIFQPAGHPINRGKVPQDFAPLSFEELEDEILENDVYGPGSYLASSSVRKTHGSWIMKVFSYGRETSIGQRFESTEKEAAILIMPHGSTSKDLRNTRGVRELISGKAQDWYTYARHNRGRDVSNGDIRVVVGIDKVSSWGIATSACNTGQTASFVFMHDSRHFYRWDCVGGSGRVGPNQNEIGDLTGDNAVAQNQCVFVRTINFSLSGEMRNNFPSEAVEQLAQVSDQSGYTEGSANLNNQGESRGHLSSDGSSTSSSHQSSSMPGSLHCKQSVTFDPVQGVNHPSTALHKYLHEKFPDANMVITEDMDWISALNDDDIVFPEPEDLYARILETHEPQNDGGVVQLLRKDDSRLRTGSSTNLGRADTEGTSVQEGTSNTPVSSAIRKAGNGQEPTDNVTLVTGSTWAIEVRKLATKLFKQFATMP